jgi:hypothetical protein
MVPVLAALNRAGFVTTGSQPGFDGGGHEGARWQQRAAVEGFSGRRAMLALTWAAGEAGLVVVAHDPASLPRWRVDHSRSAGVTRRHDRVVTRFGAHLPRRFIRDSWTGWGACHPDAAAALCGAWQVTVIDPGWGREGLLWDVLSRALCPAGSGKAGAVS